MDRQVGGAHYKHLPIQPALFCELNKLSFLESCVVKRVARHRHRGRAEDLRKAIHELELLLDIVYGEGPDRPDPPPSPATQPPSPRSWTGTP